MINSDNNLSSNQGKYFDDFSIGDKYILPSRTQTSGVFSMFQAA